MMKTSLFPLKVNDPLIVACNSGGMTEYADCMFSELARELAAIEIRRGAELHPGFPELQQHWDAYLDAVDLARRSGEAADKLTAARLYLTYAKARDAQENAL